MLISFRKMIGLFSALTLMSVAATALLALPADAKPAPKVKIQASVVEAGQNPMLNRGVLKVKVRSNRKGKLRVRALSATFDGKGVYKPLTQVAWPRFKRAGQWR